MEKEADAKAAIAQLNGKEVKGKRINVELSTKGQKKGPGLAIQSGDKTKKPGEEGQRLRAERTRSVMGKGIRARLFYRRRL